MMNGELLLNLSRAIVPGWWFQLHSVYFFVISFFFHFQSSLGSRCKLIVLSFRGCRTQQPDYVFIFFVFVNLYRVDPQTI